MISQVGNQTSIDEGCSRAVIEIPYIQNLLLALDAYHASLHGKAAPVISGLTGDQRFFMSYAQIARAKIRPAKLREIATRDVHRPDKFRVLGVLPNVDGWHEAFNVKPYVSPTRRASAHLVG